MARFASGFLAALVLAPSVPAQEPAGVRAKVWKIQVGGEGFWDYLTVDSAAHRLYVSRGNRVVVIDTDTEKVVGEVADTPGIHGIAILSDINRGLTSNGGDSTVTAFDLKTLKSTGKLKVGSRPDAILFDPVSHRVFTFNHGSKDATAIDPAGLTVVGSVPLAGVPEAGVSDGHGKVYVNLEDTNEVVEFDAKSLQVLNRWPLTPGERPTGLAMDREYRRLFSVCSGPRGSEKMMVLDPDKGRVIGSIAIGQGTDGCAFDPEKRLAFSSNGRDGTVTVLKEESPTGFRAAGTIKTQQGARTIAIDPARHRLYLSAASFAPAPAGQPKAVESKEKAKGKFRRPNMIPGSFVIVVVEIE